MLKGLAIRKQGCPEPLVWSMPLKEKVDHERFKALNRGLRTWDLWNRNDCLPRKIFTPLAQLNPILLLFNRKCWSFDMDDRPDTRPEIEPYLRSS